MNRSKWGLKYLYLVITTAMPIPEWAYAAQKQDFAREPMKVWLARDPARQLFEMDTEEGGSPMLMKVQVARCPVCKELKLGVDGNEQRRRLMSYTGRMKTCGPECQRRANAKRKWRPS